MPRINPKRVEKLIEQLGLNKGTADAIRAANQSESEGKPVGDGPPAPPRVNSDF